MAWRRMGKWMYRSTFSWPRHITSITLLPFFTYLLSRPRKLRSTPWKHAGKWRYGSEHSNLGSGGGWLASRAGPCTLREKLPSTHSLCFKIWYLRPDRNGLITPEFILYPRWKETRDTEQPLRCKQTVSRRPDWGMLATCRGQIDVPTPIQVSGSRATLDRCQATTCTVLAPTVSQIQPSLMTTDANK
jgi:hypothetical protein